MKIELIVGTNIKFYRYKLKMSQEKFCLMHGFSRAYLNELEQGKRNPSIVLLDKIAKALNVSVDKLLVYNPKHEISKKRIDERVKN